MIRGALLLCLTFVASAPGQDILAPVRQVLENRREQIARTDDAIARGRLQLETGLHEDAVRAIPDFLRSGKDGENLATEVLFAVNDFERLTSRMERFTDSETDGARRRLLYEWWFLIRDLPRIESTTESFLSVDSTSVSDLLAAGRLERMLLRYDRSRRLYEQALEHAGVIADSAEALHGLAQVAYRKRDFDGGLEHLTAAIRIDPLVPGQLMTLASLLIRMGRIEEAIDAVELAVVLAPEHGSAHYMLGNGYARRSYTQLFALYPEAFADSAGRRHLARADSLLDAGSHEEARQVYAEIGRSHPEWADPLVRIGSLDFEEGRFDQARVRFKKALAICPEYGRAHNGLAKAIEEERLVYELNRRDYEARFEEIPLPDVPGIDRFILNWHALSPRHQKRVALSVAPWARYVPVLLEGEMTYYIKPIYELLSETPGQKTLRDRRISYDSRLWDDTRGCGGYHTVTGIEDVEESILNRYDTVLHELTHQVHGVLSSDRGRQIQELYRRCKERDEENGDAFLSRYAAGSVWEYFAEGANALSSPRWDAFDTREIVRERLLERDPDLVALLGELMADADIDSCYAVAYVNKGYKQIEKADVDGSIETFQKALRRLPGEETAIGALVYALQLSDSARAAFALADTAFNRQPESGQIVTMRAEAAWHAGLGLRQSVLFLSTHRDSVREEDRHLVDLSLGRNLWLLGNAEAAMAAYLAARDYQEDNPRALWGQASSLGLAERWEEAWDLYEEAIRGRSGVAELRGDFARDLLLAGETERAQGQIEEALLIDPTSPRVRALEAWTVLTAGDADSAVTLASNVLDCAPWCDLALLVKARAEHFQGRSEDAAKTLEPWTRRILESEPPDFVFRPRWGRYEMVHTLPAAERRILPATLLASLGLPDGDSK